MIWKSFSQGFAFDMFKLMERLFVKQFQWGYSNFNRINWKRSISFNNFQTKRSNRVGFYTIGCMIAFYSIDKIS